MRRLGLERGAEGCPTPRVSFGESTEHSGLLGFPSFSLSLFFIKEPTKASNGRDHNVVCDMDSDVKSRDPASPFSS